MGHIWLCVLGFFWTNTLGRAEAQKFNATLRAANVIVPVGGDVTLDCAVDSGDPSEWRYRWFRRTTDSFEELSIGNGLNATVSVTRGGIYSCRAGRENWTVSTEDSNHVTIHKVVPNRVLLALQPDWTDIFEGEEKSLRCNIAGGEGTEWEYDWTTPNSNVSTSSNEYVIKKAVASNNGDYWCKGRHKRDQLSSTEWSNVVTLTYYPRPKVQISADRRDLIEGGTVTLTCTVYPSSPGWEYTWVKNNMWNPPQYSSQQYSVSEGGRYWCRGRRGTPAYFTENSDELYLKTFVANKAVVTLQPNWPRIYRGEDITLTCEIEDGENTDWEYEWGTPNFGQALKRRENTFTANPRQHNGDYTCIGKKVGQDPRAETKRSDTYSLRVYNYSPSPNLIVSPEWVSPGDSVTLKCKVEHPSAGWRLYWYKAVPSSKDSYSYELLPGSSSGTEDDTLTVPGQMYTTGYVCRAGRGTPTFYTQYSKPKFVWSGDSRSASITVSSGRVQHFPFDSVSLSCEENSVKWRVKSFNMEVSDCKMSGAICEIPKSQQGTTVYWCESESGDFSNAVNISVHRNRLILVSPVQPVTEGESFTLGCRSRPGVSPCPVSFFKNGRRIGLDAGDEFKIVAASKSDEGLYMCKCGKMQSPESWISVKPPKRSSSVVLGLTLFLLGIVMLVSLLLFCYYKRNKGLHSLGKIPCLWRNLSSTDQTVNQDVSQQNVYSSLTHGDVSIYETITNKGNGGTEPEYSDIGSPSIQLNSLNNNRKQDDSNSSDYANLESAKGP